MEIIGNLTGKVVVVTGASSGIGQAVAKMAAEHGAKLVLAARREEHAFRISGYRKVG